MTTLSPTKLWFKILTPHCVCCFFPITKICLWEENHIGRTPLKTRASSSQRKTLRKRKTAIYLWNRWFTHVSSKGCVIDMPCISVTLASYTFLPFAGVGGEPYLTTTATLDWLGIVILFWRNIIRLSACFEWALVQFDKITAIRWIPAQSKNNTFTMKRFF